MKPSSCALLSLAFLAACTSLQGDKQHNQGAQDVQVAENLKHAGDTAGAVHVLRQAQAEQPNDPLILSQLGYTLIANGQPQDAVDVFDKLISLQPNNVSAYNGKAVALDRCGRHLAAQAAYRQALKLAPDSLSIKNNLAMSMILNNQLDQAVAMLEQLNRQGNNPTVRQNLALAYGLEGDRKKALALNLQDLPEAQAKENMRFYARYARERQKTDDDSIDTASSGDDLFTNPPPSPNKSSFPASLDDLLTSSAAANPPATQPQHNSQDKAVQKTVAAVPAIPSPLLTPPAPAPVTVAYPSQSKPSATVLPTAAPASSTPASQKSLLPPPIAPAAPDASGQSRRESNPVPVAALPPLLQGIVPAPLTSASCSPSLLVKPAIADALAQRDLAEKLQMLIPTAGNEESAMPAVPPKHHVRHRRKKKPAPPPTAPVQSPPSFLGIGVNPDGYSYPSQGTRSYQ